MCVCVCVCARARARSRCERSEWEASEIVLCFILLLFYESVHSLGAFVLTCEEALISIHDYFSVLPWFPTLIQSS